MSAGLVNYHVEDGVAWISINRPEVLNALNDEAHRQLREALRRAEGDEEVKVVVLSGEGEAFCVGADVRDFVGAEPMAVRKHVEESRRTIEALVKLSKPAVAMVNGLALGTGCELVMACDLAIASTDAKLGQPEVKLGMMPGLGATQRLAMLLGPKRAKELLMTGRLLSAEEAVEVGLINRAVPREELKRVVKELAEELKKRDPVVLRLIKDVVNEPLEALISAGLSLELESFALNFSSEAPHRGIKGFLERRRT
ncbi:MAG: enoyl-CoA hydratase/isomerase family protein [Candidatus Nezhaarchaeota archaeon]|nr:enoyl-CoA hydratase/isomerase family protein [Candidatus Nezhaarchaeota archaeon]